MATRQFTREELLRSERFIAQLASENVPDGDFGEGTNLRDLAIRAMAATVMYMQSEGDDIRALSELNQIQQIEDDDERTEALDAYASNLFLTRGGGARARGFVQVTLSSRVSVTIPVGTRFLAGTLVFFLDSSAVFFYPESLLNEVVDVTGTTVYTFQVPVIAVSVGEEYSIDSQVFTRWDPFNTEVTRVESLNRFSGGQAEETVDEFLLRVEDAITVRNLLTPRAINTVLPEQFPEIQSVQVVEAGDPEMTRDLAPLITPGVNIHTGGAVDVYVFTAVTETTQDFVLGIATSDASGPLDTFIDIDFNARNVDWRGRVKEGDLLRVTNARANEGSLYTIVEVDSFYLRVQPLIPFKELRPLRKHGGLVYEGVSVNVTTRTVTFGEEVSLFIEDDVGSYLYLGDGTRGFYFEIESVGQFVDGFATEVTVLDPDDDLSDMDTSTGVNAEVYDTYLEYSIGNNYPNFDNKIPRRITGRVSREIRTPGTVIMPNMPVYRFKEVTILSTTDPNADPTVGGVPYTVQTVDPPTGFPEFQVFSKRIDHAQSAEASLRLRIGPEDTRAGTDGLFSNTLDAQADFSSASVTFYPEDVGLYILITEAVNQVNLGLYRIETFISSTKVRVEKASGLVELESLLTNPLLSEANLTWNVDARFINDGQTLRTTFEWLVGFSNIAAYVDAGEDRVVSASTLARAPHPIYVSFQLQYELKPTATADIDVAAARRFLANYIREFPAFDVLNVSDIVTAFRTEYTDVGNVKLPMTIDYSLISPDGGLVNFQSTDEIVVKEALAATTTDAERYLVATAHGVSDRTIKYMSFEDLITVIRV